MSTFTVADLVVENSVTLSGGAVAAPVSQTPDQANSAGSATSLSRSDHVHNIPTAAPVTQVPDQANSDGIAGTFSRSDHVHTIATAAPATQNATNTNSIGASTSFSRADHLHTISTGTPSTQTPDQGNSTGTSANLARADHVHTIATAVAVDISTANAQGASMSFSRADHAHRGVRSVKAGTGGTQRFGDLSIDAGTGTSVVDDGAGNFTVDTQFGANEFVITSTSGLTVNYTGGRFINGVNGSVTTVASGSIAVPASTTGYLYISVNSLGLIPTVNASATVPGADSLAFGKFVSGLSTVTSTSDSRVFVGTLPLTNQLRMTYPGTGLIVSYNSGGVRINGVFTSIVAGTITLANSIASGAIYVDATSSTVTANTTGTFPSNCVPLAVYTTSGGAVTALSGQRTFLNTNVTFGASGDIVSLTPNLSAAAGSTNRYADASHIHNVPTAAPVNQTIAAALADGSAATFSRSDHIHTFSTAAAVAQTPNQSNAAGTSTSFARADHVHNIATAAPAAQTPDNANADGAATTFSRSDHVHNIATAAAVSISTSTANAQGAATTFARSNHTHAVSVTSLEASATANATTTSTTDVLMTTMTQTPASGTWLVVFSGVFTNSVAADTTFCNIYVGGTIQSDTERSMVHPASFGNLNGTIIPMSTNKIVTVNGAQAVEIRWRVSAGTGTVSNRTMSMIKLS